MRKRTFLGLAVAAVLGAAGTTGAAHAEMAAEITKPVTITFYNYNLATASAGADATREMIAKFEQEHPLIKVKTVGVPSNDIITRLQADMAAGMQPDVAQLVFRDLIYLASDLGAQPLEDMAGAKGYAALTDGLIPRGVDLGKINGKTYGLAYTFSTPILYYNADLFRKAGLDPETPPKTWAEVKTAAEAIVAKTGVDGFFPGAYGPTDGTFVYQAILMSNGGKVRDGNTPSPTRMALKRCRCCATWSTAAPMPASTRPIRRRLLPPAGWACISTPAPCRTPCPNPPTASGNCA